MNIRILRNIGRKDTQPRSGEYPNSMELPPKEDGSLYREGEVVAFDKEDAEKFIKFGIGEETSDPVGPPPAPRFVGVQPIPVQVVEPEPADQRRTVQPAHKPHRAEPPENPPGNKPDRK